MFDLQKLVTRQLLKCDFCIVQMGTFYRHPGYEKGIFYKKIASSYRRLVRLRHENHNLFKHGSKLEPFNQNLTELNFFINTPSQITMVRKNTFKISSSFKM